MHKGQGRRSLLDDRDLWALRRHCITYQHDSLIDITKWAQEYFQKPLSVNMVMDVNMVQKRRHVLWVKVHLKWTVSKWKSVPSPSPNLTFVLEITDAVSSGLKRMRTFQRVISIQFKIQHL